MFIRAYLRASTKNQDALRAKSELEALAAEQRAKNSGFLKLPKWQGSKLLSTRHTMQQMR